jgi:LysR family transcriptional activator of dmlA
MTSDVAEIQLFVEIIKADNLSVAIRAWNSSPVAMSRALSSLESRLGARLVTHTSRSFELTEEGSLFYNRCQKIVTDIAKAEAEASSPLGAVKGKLRIGTPNELGRQLIASLITRFVQKYPEVEVHLTLSDSGLDVIDE